MTTLAAVADELYARAPEEFTAARDAAAKNARDNGDRELADAVKVLRRPSVGAWLVNQLARSHGARLDELLELGETLRAAQDALDASELRTMTKQRREMVASLSSLAQDLAESADHKIGDAAQREIEATLDAALADEAAAQAVRSGRLMRTLTSTGLEAVDLSGAVAAPDDLPRPGPRRPVSSARGVAAKPARKSSGKPGRQPVDKRRAAAGKRAAKAAAKAAGRAAAKADQQAIRQAQRQLDAAEAELAEQESALRVARDAVTSARSRAAEAEAALEEANRAARDAGKRRREAEQAQRSAVRAREAARRALAVARKRADRE